MTVMCHFLTGSISRDGRIGASRSATGPVAANRLVPFLAEIEPSVRHNRAPEPTLDVVDTHSMSGAGVSKTAINAIERANRNFIAKRRANHANPSVRRRRCANGRTLRLSKTAG
jgi:hypothetical protein